MSDYQVSVKPLAKQPECDWKLVSLPLPEGGPWQVDVAGMDSQAVPVGFWPRSEQRPAGPRIPRRVLLYMQGSQAEPEVSVTGVEDIPIPDADGTGWKLRVEDLENICLQSKPEYLHHCRAPGQLVLEHAGRQFTLRLGIRNAEGLHLWQYVVAEQVWAGPLCAAWRVGGHIFTGNEDRMTSEHYRSISDHIRDLTIAASAYVVVFRDGTVQVTGHWVNGRLYGRVSDQEGVPVVLVGGLGLTDEERSWQGTEAVLAGGQGTVNLEPAAHLVSAEHPGRITIADDLAEIQPIEDTRLVVRYVPDPDHPGQVKGGAIQDSEQGLKLGAAAAATIMLKLGSGVPRVTRCLAPRDWYAQCCEFAPFPIAPKIDIWDTVSAECTAAQLKYSVTGCYASGAIWRYFGQLGKGCIEYSMDGHECRALLRRAYWSGDAAAYDLGLRNAWFTATIAVDHFRDIVHYHGDQGNWEIYSLIYMRFGGCVLGYLETGDWFLLETSQAVARNYINTHLQNWPRRGIGRDSEPLEGIMTLWDYTGEEMFWEFGRRFAGCVATVIHEDGKWLCGAGVGPEMGCNALEGGPWNGGHFLHGFSPWAMRASRDEIPPEWLEKARLALAKLYHDLEHKDHGYHPATGGFIGKSFWYLACLVGDQELIDQTHHFMQNILDYREHPTDPDNPLFRGGKAHHMYNYAEYPLFYASTRDGLPDMLSR